MNSEQCFLGFLDYLSDANPDLNAVAQYLVRFGFANLDVSASTISKLGNDGVLRVIASFGLTGSNPVGLAPIPFGVQSPLSAALRNNEIVAAGDIHAFVDKHVGILAEDFAVPFESSVICAIPKVGVLTIFAQSPIVLTPELLSCLRTVCAIVSMHIRYVDLLALNELARLTGAPGPVGPAGLKGDTGSQGVAGDRGERGLQGVTGVTGDRGLQGVTGDTGSQGVAGDTGSQGVAGDTGSQGVAGDTGSQGVTGDTGSQGVAGDRGLETRGNSCRENEVNSELTIRQKMIVTSIQRGMTNSQIAEDLGFSASLIRQETMEIYRKMNIAGRQDLMG